MLFLISSKNLVLSILSLLLQLKKRDTLWWIANFKGI
jgi:maltodextrin utilization protein YvdJ